MSVLLFACGATIPVKDATDPALVQFTHGHQLTVWKCWEAPCASNYTAPKHLNGERANCLGCPCKRKARRHESRAHFTEDGTLHKHPWITCLALLMTTTETP